MDDSFNCISMAWDRIPVVCSAADPRVLQFTSERFSSIARLPASDNISAACETPLVIVARSRTQAHALDSREEHYIQLSVYFGGSFYSCGCVREIFLS